MASGADYVAGVLALWLCNTVVECLILVRLGLRKWRRLRFTVSDGWLVVALVFNGLRMTGDYYINEYGTPLSTAVRMAEVPPADSEPVETKITPQEQSGFILAGKFMIVARTAIILVLWSLKLAILDTLICFLRKLRCERPVRWFMYAIMALTFLATLLSVFLECNDLDLNWKLFPGADECSYDAAWIITYEISNIITDTMLFFLLVLLILRAPIPRWERARLSIFGLGAILIAIEITRLAKGVSYTDILLDKIVWGSVEVTIAALVATLPTICVLLRMGSKESQGEIGKKVDRGPVESSATTNTARGTHQRGQTPPHTGILDGFTPMDTGIGDDTRMLPSRGSHRGSIIGSTSAEVGNQDGRTKPWLPFRTTHRSSHPATGTSPRMRALDENREDSLTGWIELEEIDAGDVSAELSSVEPDEVGNRSGIFVATEINREAHQLRGLDRRPRIITIPQRAKVDHSQV